MGAIRAIYDNNKLFCDQTLRILVLWKDLKEVNNRSISNAIKKYKLGNREELEEKSKNISLKYLLAIINSRMGQFLLDGIRGINNKDINPDSLRLIPIPIADKQTQEKIKDAVDSIMKNNDECSKEITSFSKWLKRTFEVELNFDYSNLDFEDFLKKIKKQNKKLNNRKTQDTIENEFISSLEIISSLKEENMRLESKINEIIYRLYKLTSEDIAIIKNSFQK